MAKKVKASVAVLEPELTESEILTAIEVAQRSAPQAKFEAVEKLTLRVIALEEDALALRVKLSKHFGFKL